MLSRLLSIAVAALLALTLSACGIALRPVGPVSAASPDRVNPILPPPPEDPLVLAPGQTVVSITFDDGRASNLRAAQILNAYGLRGTFFINSGTLGKPGYLTLADVDSIATSSGNEIAGHTIRHKDLGKLNADEARHEICDDRAQLMEWGFPVRSFAYPFAVETPETRAIIEQCGYNSARSLGELRTVRLPSNANASDCSLCAWSEAVPPANPFYTKAPAQVTSSWTLRDMQAQVNIALFGDGSRYSGDGGWVQITFHGICPSDCTDISAAEGEYTAFVKWLADQQSQGILLVRTVGEVIGGPVHPAVHSEGER